MNVLKLLIFCFIVSSSALANNVTVTDATGNPIKEADVYFINKTKKTYVSEKTNEKGQANLESPGNRLVTVFCAHPSYAAYQKGSHPPDQPLVINLRTVKDTGSVVCPDGTGYVPGLIGRLSPILDTSNRLYMYADNIALEKGLQQPVKFRLRRSIRAEDRDGNRFDIKVVEIIGKTSLIEFTKK